MIKKFKAIFWKPEGMENLKAPDGTKMKFELFYKELLIGVLELSNGSWEFQYSSDFKNQNEVIELVDFPNKDKTYRRNDLWPFFVSRIPGLGQPEVQKIIANENIDSNDEAALLKRFGFRSITNPFILTASI